MKTITPLILCGGSGTRLWPLSRQAHPKQFQPVHGGGGHSFFQTTVLRHGGRDLGKPIVVSSQDYSDKISQSLRDIGRDAQLIFEPTARGTGPAVLAAALVAARLDPKTLLLVSPADHMIDGDMSATIKAARTAALAGQIVLFGITPRYAETGYGYILDAGALAGDKALRKSAGFVEKPSHYRASELIASKRAYWASGISLFTAETIIAEFARLAPSVLQSVRAALPEACSDVVHLGARNYAHAQSGSTETLIFEHSSRVVLAPVDVKWSDVGCWTSMYGLGERDARGNVLEGDVLTRDTKNSYVRSDGKLVAVVGMNDVIVVDTEDALLVTRRGGCQNVGKLVQDLRKRASLQAPVGPSKPNNHPVQPWGDSLRLKQAGRVDLAMTVIQPGGSFHSTAQRDQQFVVMAGQVHIEEARAMRRIETRSSVQVAEGQVAMLHNFGDTPCEVMVMTYAAGPVGQRAKAKRSFVAS